MVRSARVGARRHDSRRGRRDQVQIDASAELPAIHVDAGLLEQALATLLQNAATHGSSFEPCVLSIRREGDLMRFDVNDRGPGIPLGIEERLFDKFFRAPSSATGGLGLGLSIARRLAEAHGGTLTNENRPAGGARFTSGCRLAASFICLHETKRADHR